MGGATLEKWWARRTRRGKDRGEEHGRLRLPIVDEAALADMREN